MAEKTLDGYLVTDEVDSLGNPIHRVAVPEQEDTKEEPVEESTVPASGN